MNRAPTPGLEFLFAPQAQHLLNRASEALNSTVSLAASCDTGIQDGATKIRAASTLTTFYRSGCALRFYYAEYGCVRGAIRRAAEPAAKLDESPMVQAENRRCGFTKRIFTPCQASRAVAMHPVQRFALRA